MPRSRHDRLAEIVEAAVAVFSRVGFTGAQVSDIAAEAGVSVGTIYNYVADKDTLLTLCLERELAGPPVEIETLPVSRPAGGDLAEIEKVLDSLVRSDALEQSLIRLATAKPEAVAQLGVIVGELFDLIERTRKGADALERSAQDVPELAAMFYARVRSRLVGQLAVLIGRWSAAGLVPPPTDASVTARACLETITWLARHRHGDFDGAAIDAAAARATAIDFVCRAVAG